MVSSTCELCHGSCFGNRGTLNPTDRNMPNLTFHVDNLKCGGCANSIRKRLSQLPSIGTVIVDPEASSVTVTHDGALTHEEVAAVLMDLGYPETGTGGFAQKAKSYISCAVGRFQGED